MHLRLLETGSRAMANAREIFGENEEKAMEVSLDAQFLGTKTPGFRIVHKNP